MDPFGGIVSTINASNFIPLGNLTYQVSRPLEKSIYQVRKNDEERNPNLSLQQYEPTDGQMPSYVLPT